MSLQTGEATRELLLENLPGSKLRRFQRVTIWAEPSWYKIVPTFTSSQVPPQLVQNCTYYQGWVNRVQNCTNFRVATKEVTTRYKIVPTSSIGQPGTKLYQLSPQHKCHYDWAQNCTHFPVVTSRVTNRVQNCTNFVNWVQNCTNFLPVTSTVTSECETTPTFDWLPSHTDWAQDCTKFSIRYNYCHRLGRKLYQLRQLGTKLYQLRQLGTKLYQLCNRVQNCTNSDWVQNCTNFSSGYKIVPTRYKYHWPWIQPLHSYRIIWQPH